MCCYWRAKLLIRSNLSRTPLSHTPMAKSCHTWSQMKWFQWHMMAMTKHKPLEECSSKLNDTINSLWFGSGPINGSDYMDIDHGRGTVFPQQSIHSAYNWFRIIWHRLWHWFTGHFHQSCLLFGLNWITILARFNSYLVHKCAVHKLQLNL